MNVTTRTRAFSLCLFLSLCVYSCVCVYSAIASINWARTFVSKVGYSSFALPVAVTSGFGSPVSVNECFVAKLWFIKVFRC